MAGLRHQRAGARDAGRAPSSAPASRPGEQVAIALDIAASEFGRGGHYRLALEGRELDSDGMIELLPAGSTAIRSSRSRTRWPRTTPTGFAAFTRAVGERVQVVGDDFLVTDAARVREAAAARRRQRRAAQAEPARHADRDAGGAGRRRSEAGYAGIVSARSGETEDTTIVHLAVGWGVGQLKVGSFARGERMAKWNEALRIEEALGARRALRRRRACWGGRAR